MSGLPVLADTHALHWWLADPSRLSDTARARLAAAEEASLASRDESPPGGCLIESDRAGPRIIR